MELHPSGEFINAIKPTVRPRDAKAQGFVDENGVPFDYALRCFCPWVGIDEDPATGSAQCGLAPF